MEQKRYLISCIKGNVNYLALKTVIIVPLLLGSMLYIFSDLFALQSADTFEKVGKICVLSFTVGTLLYGHTKINNMITRQNLKIIFSLFFAVCIAVLSFVSKKYIFRF